MPIKCHINLVNLGVFRGGPLVPRLVGQGWSGVSPPIGSGRPQADSTNPDREFIVSVYTGIGNNN